MQKYKIKSNRIALIAGGGTGGHLFPGIAIGDALQKNGYNVQYIGSKHGLEAKIFSKLKSLKSGKSGEFHITDAIQALIDDDNQFVGHNFSGKYLDCGTMKGYIKSTLEISKQ